MKSLYLARAKAFIRYHEMPGEGAPLVCLPGLYFPSLANFLPVAAHPDLRGRRAFLVDYLGSGFSDRPRDFAYSLENHGRSVAAILDHEGVKACTIVGYSMGGTIGILLALQRPDLVAKLIVCEGNVTAGGGGLTKLITSYSEADFVKEAFPAFLERWRQAAMRGDLWSAFLAGAWAAADPAAIHAISTVIVNLDPAFKESFLTLTMRRVFIYGETSVPQDGGEILADAPDPRELERHGIRIGVVPEVGHGLMIENPDGFVKVLKDAL